ncbi:hypothetical protein ABPG75_003461 [Micractinium tetrahymenae]
MADILQRRPRFMLVSDLDWTMVDHNDATHEKLRRFNRLWLTEFAPDSLLVFSSGRSPELFHELASEVPLLKPDILVCSVGTEILINGQADAEWEAHLNEGWDRAAAEGIAAKLPELEMQRESEQRPHKISYKLRVADPDRVLGALRSDLAAAGLDTNVIFSGGEDLDILPSRASKGKALSFLLKQFESGPGLPEAGVMVCGDSGNDIELFVVPGVHGCMVANAHKELRDWCEANMHDRIFAATQDGPGGIYEALHHFSFPNPAKADTVHRRQAVCAQQAWAEEWCNGSVPQDDAACEAHMLEGFEEDFEYVHSSGQLMTRRDLTDWFASEGYACCAGGSKAAAAAGGDRGAAPVPAAPGTAGVSPGAGTGSGSEASGSGRLCMWVDRYSERQLAQGVWLARWMELYQPFVAGKHTAGERTAKWASAVLRQHEGDAYRFAYLHESPVPREQARA